MAHNVLVVEDDPQQAGVLKDILVDAGYRVILAAHAEAALDKLRSSMPDLAIMDLGLPGLSGMKLCSLIKEDPRTAALPIIMLTSRNRPAEKVEGLNTGADDYLTKPYGAKELIARVEALLRRVERQGLLANVLRSGKIEVNLDAHEVKIAGKSVGLSPKEYDLLVLFLKKKGHVLLYSYIAEVVWGDERRATRQDVIGWVHRLRDKLGTHGSAIEAVTTQGYKFSGD